MKNEIHLTDHIGLVKHIAGHICRKHNVRIGQSYQDLLGVGLVALAESGEHFHAEANCAFSTYAWPRIKGAMLDHLNREGRHASLQWLPEHPILHTRTHIENEVEAREHLQLLDDAVKRLPYRRQKIMQSVINLQPLQKAAEDVVIDIRKARRWRREFLSEWEEILEAV